MKMLTLIFLMVMGMALMSLSVSAALGGGSSNGYSTNVQDYFIFMDMFNTTIEGDISLSSTTSNNGQDWVDNGGGTFFMANGSAISQHQSEAVNFFRTRDGIPSYNLSSYNFTCEIYFNITLDGERGGASGQDFILHGYGGEIPYNSKLFGVGVAPPVTSSSRGELAFRIGNSGGYSPLNYIVNSTTSVMLQIVVNNTNSSGSIKSSINSTFYNVTNQSSSLNYVQIGDSKTSINIDNILDGFIINDNDNTGGSSVFVKEFVCWNWTSKATALDRPLAITEPDSISPTIQLGINNTAIDVGISINVSANLTDNANLSFCQVITNQTGVNEIFNFSVESRTSANCSQNFTIVAVQTTMNFTIRVNDSSGNKAQANQILFSNDVTSPTILSLNFSATSIVDGNNLNFTINTSDTTSFIQTIRFNFTNPNGLNFTRTMSIASNVKDLIGNYTIFSGSETSVVGVLNITYVSVTDSSVNLIEDRPNITFEVTSAGGGGSTGGGGGGTPLLVVVNQTNVTTICNRNGVCND